MPTKTIFIYVFLLIAVACGLVAPFFLTAPAGWVLAGLGVLTLCCALWTKQNWVIYASMICMPILGAAAFMEFHLHVMRYSDPPQVFEGSYKSNWDLQDPIRGYGPKPEVVQINSKAYRRGKLLYDVTYTTNEQGWRITPQHAEADTAVIFAGCSFTMSEGVNDAEGYPYLVGTLLGQKYQTFNFGFHGYGSHQFLASVEAGSLDEILKKYPRVYVFFLNLSRHEMRAGGYSPWDERGPRYVLENGVVERRGSFERWYYNSTLLTAVHNFLLPSHLYKDVVFKPQMRQLPALQQLDSAILAKAQKIIEAKRPDADFTVLLYPGAAPKTQVFAKAGLATVDTVPFFPLPPEDPRYEIQDDGHPTVEAHAVLAKGIVQWLHSQEAQKTR